MKNVLLFSLLFAIVCSPSYGLSQSVSEQAIQDLLQSPMIIAPQSVLQDLMDGKPTTSVIVLLRDPGSPAATPAPSSIPQISNQGADGSGGESRAMNLQSMDARQQRQVEVRAVLDRVIGGLDSTRINVSRRFTYMPGFAAEVTLQGLQDLNANPDVVSIEPNRILSEHTAQGIPLMNALGARSTYHGTGISIAICDTGIDTSHPMLGGGGAPIFNSKVIGGYDVGDGDADPRPNLLLGSAHGTCCAGIAAGDITVVGDYIGGVAPGAKLYAVKISAGNTGSATEAAMIAGWEWCLTHQNDDSNNPILIVSTSFGGGQEFAACNGASPAMTTAAANAVAAGITLFCSSGNNGYCDSMGWPACISHVISVGAVYDAAFGMYYPCVSSASCAPKIATGGCTTGWYASDSTAADLVTSYSNAASFLSLLAPSNMAYTTDIVGSGGYDPGNYYPSFGGTSAACPYAAGSAAVLQSAAKALNGSYLTPARVREVLTGTGDPIPDPKTPITKPRVNLGETVDAISGTTVLWDQPLSGVNTNTFADQDFEPDFDTYDIFLADDFINTQPWSIKKIFVDGNTWNPGIDLTCATALHFQIYKDDAGTPDGYPGGGNAPVWELSVAPADPRVSLSTGVGGFQTNVTLTLDTPVVLPPGTQWLLFYPTMTFSGCGQYGRHVSDTTNGNVAQVINPGAGFGFPTVWTSIQSPTTWSMTQHDLAFQLKGAVTSPLQGAFMLLLGQ